MTDLEKIRAEVEAVKRVYPSHPASVLAEDKLKLAEALALVPHWRSHRVDPALCEGCLAEKALAEVAR